jgi:hypothetical protein
MKSHEKKQGQNKSEKEEQEGTKGDKKPNKK